MMTTSDIVKHINGDRTDNHLANLEWSDRVLNALTTKRPTKGWYRVKNRKKPYLALITVDGVRKCLGYHKTSIEAAAAWLKAHAELLESLNKSRSN